MGLGLGLGFVHLKKKTTMKKVTTTKLFIATIVSCTQEKRKGNKTVGGETPRNKHKPKPQECTTTVKRVCSPKEEHNNEEECDDNCCHFHLLHTKEERREYDHKGKHQKINTNQNQNQNYKRVQQW